MVRIKRGKVAAKRRRSFLKLAKGYVGVNSRLSIFATEQIIQSLNYAYKGRKLKKRFFRRIWISRINAASRARQTTYSSFLGSLRKADIFLNRKVLAYLAFTNLSTFNLLHRNINIHL